MTDLAKLKELAKAATPGPWEACDRGDYSDNDGNSRVILGDDMKLGLVFDYGGNEGEAEAAFIAAANPTAILALISRLEEAEKAAEVERKNGELAATIYKEQRDEAVGALGRALEVISGVYAMNLLDATAAGQKIIVRFFMDGEQLFNPPAFYREARKIIDEGHAQGVVARIKGGE